MPTAIRFNNSDSDGQNGITVSESPDQILSQWHASDDGLMHLTHVRDGLPVSIVCANVSYWVERPAQEQAPTNI
jgi:hypothetical protein